MGDLFDDVHEAALEGVRTGRDTLSPLIARSIESAAVEYAQTEAELQQKLQELFDDSVTKPEQQRDKAGG